MSLVTFKKKSTVRYGTSISGKPTSVYMLPQGPFGGSGAAIIAATTAPALSGFSINGPHRNVGGVGRTHEFSKTGTSFRGVHARGFGGQLGRYAQPPPTWNSAQVETKGDQFEYNKPSVLSNYGMLRRRYRWIHSGQYPNVWVQPNYGTGSLSDNSSQGMYIHTKSIANDCVVDTNTPHIYQSGAIESCVNADGVKCSKGATYTKFLYEPVDSSEQTRLVQRKCANPREWQKPFPYATNGGTACAGARLLRVSGDGGDSGSA